MASANSGTSYSRFRALSEKIRNSPRAISKKIRRRNSTRSTDGAAIGATSFKLDDIPLDAFAKHFSTAKYKAVVAIDFGTTYSGYAYAFVNSPEEIHLMRRSDGGPGQFGMMMHKTPTTLLLNERAGFHSFGYEARETYHDLDEVDSRRWLYFEKFKMELHSRKVCKPCGCGY